MTAGTIAEITEGLRRTLGADGELNSRIKIDLQDEGVIVVDGRNRPLKVTNEDQDAECTVTMTRETLAKMLEGKLDPTAALLQGKLRIDGNIGLAVQMAPVFEKAARRKGSSPASQPH